jgi:hypothetical protein
LDVPSPIRSDAFISKKQHFKVLITLIRDDEWYGCRQTLISTKLIGDMCACVCVCVNYVLCFSNVINTSKIDRCKECIGVDSSIIVWINSNLVYMFSVINLTKVLFHLSQN